MGARRSRAPGRRAKSLVLRSSIPTRGGPSLRQFAVVGVIQQLRFRDMPIPRVDPIADSFTGTSAKRLIGKVASSPSGQWFLRNIAPRVDPTLMRLTRGRVSSLGTWPRSLLLTHTGAKSGIQRTTPLIYFTDSDRVILVASNYGGIRHPAWHYNVTANPR